MSTSDNITPLTDEPTVVEGGLTSTFLSKKLYVSGDMTINGDHSVGGRLRIGEDDIGDTVKQILDRLTELENKVAKLEQQ